MTGAERLDRVATADMNEQEHSNNSGTKRTWTATTVAASFQRNQAMWTPVKNGGTVLLIFFIDCDNLRCISSKLGCICFDTSNNLFCNCRQYHLKTDYYHHPLGFRPHASCNLILECNVHEIRAVSTIESELSVIIFLQTVKRRSLTRPWRRSSRIPGCL